MSNQFDNVSVVKKANVFFDGKCVSHTVVFADGTKKSVGVIFPSSLVFNTGAPEIMELNAGKHYEGGQSSNVPGNSCFDIETIEMLDYVCHFG